MDRGRQLHPFLISGPVDEGENPRERIQKFRPFLKSANPLGHYKRRDCLQPEAENGFPF
jgi:hypothetical protein